MNRRKFRIKDTFNGKVLKLRNFLEKTWRLDSTSGSGKRVMGVKARII
jgi:hypothetical protein